MGRLRFNNKADEIIKKNEFNYYLNNQNEINDYIKNNNPILEIGMGKGDFIINKSLQQPNELFVGIEKFSTVTIKALNKLKTKNISNLKILVADANNLIENFKENSIKKIYLNFSDPWPKARHEKRRLTSNAFLEVYKKLLMKDGLIEFKTDNESLYEYSLNNLKNNDKFEIDIIYYSNDIYEEFDNPFNHNNIQTEYEKKFLEKGNTIKKIIFKFKD